MKSQKHRKHKRPRIGLALGGGFARGLIHIGVLKELHKHHLYPDYIAGTSIGAVIAALYAAGHSPDEIAEITKTTDWKNIVDFTVPKSGLIKGQQIEDKIKRLVHNKDFKELETPLKVVAVNLDRKEKVVLSQGNVAKAVHASLAFPGIFNPVRIEKDRYVDGGIADPTPFDVVREMGADLVIAVDLSRKLRTIKGPEVRETTLFSELKKKLIAEELLNLKQYLTPKKFPQFIIRIIHKLFDKLLYPQKILKIIARKRPLPIIRVIHQSNTILHNNLAKERLKNADIDILINPSFGSLSWNNFREVDQFIRIGQKAMQEKIGLLKRKLRGE